MPPRKRSSQSKRTPPASPTASTSHAPADQHHHLRHTGPSISTRTRASTTSSKPPPVPAQPEPTSESPATQKDPHEKRLLAEVTPPGARTSFTTFMYVLLFLVLLVLGWYVYGMVTLFEDLRDDVGWWGIILGHSGGFSSDRRSGGAEVVGGGGDLEGSLNALADALGISPVEVASAVKPLIPQASLTSVASKAKGTGRSEAVRVLLFEDTRREG